MQYYGEFMFNENKIAVLGFNYLSDQKLISLIPIFIPDEVGPWAVKYTWIIKKDDPNFVKNYHSVQQNSKQNIRKETDHLSEHWKAFNALIINHGHLGNIVWRIKLTNIYSNTIDIIEIWRSRELIEQLFTFSKNMPVEIEQAIVHNSSVAPASSDLSSGGTGLINGSGLTCFDYNAPRVYTLENKTKLEKGIWDSGFDMRTWKTFPLISKSMAKEIFYRLLEMSKTNKNIKINTSLNEYLN